MLRVLLSSSLLFAAATGVSAQTTIDITNQAGTATCSYPVGVVTSSSTPGHLQAQLTGTPTGTGCSSGGGGGTPAANFTFTTSGLGVNFTDASTDPGGSINAWSWNFGDRTTSTVRNPSHTYAAAGTYSVILTVTDSVSGAYNSKTQSVTVTAQTGGSCPTIASSTPGINNFTQLTGTQNVFYFGGGNNNVDPTSFDSMYLATWPGGYNLDAEVTLPTNKYLSEKFTIPPNYMTAANAPNPLWGAYTVGDSGFSANVSMTISTSCGDFSNPTATGSTVVTGCYMNSGQANTAIQWYNAVPYSCVLSNSTTYYLNIINANISNITPSGGGSAASTQNRNCSGGTCTVPITNGPGAWNGYTPH